MENASKALIIAGAILLAILIISLGILIYNQAKGVINDNAMSQVEITQFNTQFTQYEGKQRGSTVKSLYQAVLANNVSQDSADRQVEITSTSVGGGLARGETSLKPEISNIKTGSSYDVTIVYGQGKGNAGLVQQITISEAK